MDAPATHVPSGVKRHERTSALCSTKLTDTVAFWISHNLTLRSSEQERIILWSGEMLHYRTQLVWPRNDLMNFPSGDHILTVLSEEQLIMKSSSLEREILRTGPEWALMALFLPFLYNVGWIHCIFPDSDLSIFTAWIHFGGSSIHEDIIDGSLVPNKFEGSNLRSEAPNMNKSIGASRNNLFPMDKGRVTFICKSSEH